MEWLGGRRSAPFPPAPFPILGERGAATGDIPQEPFSRETGDGKSSGHGVQSLRLLLPIRLFLALAQLRGLLLFPLPQQGHDLIFHFTGRLVLAEILGQFRRADDHVKILLLISKESGFAVKHGRGGVISFLAPGQDKPTRLRSSTLGDGFDPGDIRAVIAGERPIPVLADEAPAPARRVNLIIDIQQRMAQGKGPAYERWAKVYNLKQMAAALQYLREHDLMDYETMAASTEAAVERFHALSGELRETEAALEKTAGLMAATVEYAKTRPVFDGYKAARYSKKYLAQHEAELSDYRAAKAALNELLAGEKLPKMADMKKARQELAGKKKALYAEYRKAQADMRQAVAVKANIDHLLGHTDGRENKAQER